MSEIVTVDKILSWPIENGWHKSPAGLYVQLGNGVQLGDYVRLGNGVRLGDYVQLGDDAQVGNGVQLGDYVRLGNGVRLGNDVRLGNGVQLGDYVTGETLNNTRRAAYAAASEYHVFSKWVTRNRKSPNFHGGNVLSYPVGAIVEVAGAEISDKQCAPGIHVFRLGFRPEWAGYIDPAHDLIEILVRVRSEDICFAGIADMDSKLRVKRVEVLT